MSTYTAYQDTAVTVSRSIEKIRKLFDKYGVKRRSFPEDLEAGQAAIQFYWQDIPISLLIDISRVKKRLLAYNPYNNRRRMSRVKWEEKMADQAARVAYVQLYYYLKVTLEIAELELFSAEALFLPHINTPQGPVHKTVVPRLTEIMSGHPALEYFAEKKSG